MEIRQCFSALKERIVSELIVLREFLDVDVPPRCLIPSNRDASTNFPIMVGAKLIPPTTSLQASVHLPTPITKEEVAVAKLSRTEFANTGIAIAA